MSIRLENVKSGIRGKGQAPLIAHLNGEKITQIPAIQAKCYECMGYYVDGRRDCKMPDCPLYPWMPYKGHEETVTE